MRAAFLFIAGIHIVGIVTLLTMQGCKREPAVEAPVDPMAMQTFEPTNAPIAETSYTTATVVSNVAPVIEPYVPPTPTTTEYVIIKGDSFEKIGKAHGVSTKAIQEANPGVESTKLQIGQKIVLPAPTSTPTATPGATTMMTSVETTYSVVSGDTLTSIAKKHGVTIKDIRTANALDTDRIKVGQKLKIPVPAPAAGVTP